MTAVVCIEVGYAHASEYQRPLRPATRARSITVSITSTTTRLESGEQVERESTGTTDVAARG